MSGDYLVLDREHAAIIGTQKDFTVGEAPFSQLSLRHHLRGQGTGFHHRHGP